MIIDKIVTANKVNYGFDFAKGRVCRYVLRRYRRSHQGGRSALQNAASVAAMVLTTESPGGGQEGTRSPAPAAPGGMDGMY